MSLLRFKLTLLCLVGLATLNAQEIIGLWQIQSVYVGQKEKTPVARWTEFRENGIYTAGNGWLQNDKGKFTLAEGYLMMSTELGKMDEAGPFQIKLNGNDEMIWTRQEDGMDVKVSLKRVREKPMSPSDKIVGFWELESYVEDGETIPLDEVDEYLRVQFRWDRIYVDKSGKTRTGYWHIHGHRTDVTLLPHGKGDPSGWRIENADEKLVLVRINSKDKIVMTFKKLHS